MSARPRPPVTQVHQSVVDLVRNAAVPIHMVGEPVRESWASVVANDARKQDAMRASAASRWLSDEREKAVEAVRGVGSSPCAKIVE